MAEKFGIEGRGQFYDDTGAIRDVVENHMLQVVAFLAMEAPTRTVLRRDSRRAGQGIPYNFAIGPKALGSRAVQGLQERKRSCTGFQGRDVCCCASGNSVMAVVGRAISGSCREVPPGYDDRSAG